MAIRVTQNTMYNNMVGHMQHNLSNYMESVQQGSSQKKINRPSDDPAGTYRVLTTRNDMVDTAQYQENVDTAKGWLNLADQVLSSNVTTAIIGLKTLAEQASTGTYDANQRLIMADQARQYFGQLLNLSNTQFEDKQIFAGHKYNNSAFQEGLAATSWDPNWDTAISQGMIKVDGNSKRSVLIDFAESGELKAGMKFKWKVADGTDENWKEGTVKATTDENGNPIFRLEPEGIGVSMTIKAEYKKKENGELELDGDNKPIPVAVISNPKFDPNQDPSEENWKTRPLSVTQAVEGESSGAKNGSFLYLRPAAFYQGDDKDPPVDVRVMGGGEITNASLKGTDVITATGTFGKNILVRFDGVQEVPGGEFKPVDLSSGEPQKFQWSYSTDGGNTWITAYAQTSGDPKDPTLRLPVPGGYMDIDLGERDENGEIIMQDGKPQLMNDGVLPIGMQTNIHPSRSDLDYEILKDTYLSVNSVGKDVFGGYYEGKPAMEDNESNLFEVVGAFIGYLEGNNQEGCQRTLAALTKAEEKVLAEATRIGGMENRVGMAADVLSFQKIDQQERLSYTEDIDLTELLTKLTRQQLTYQTVLQSSSMIMKLSLMNYV